MTTSTARGGRLYVPTLVATVAPGAAPQPAGDLAADLAADLIELRSPAVGWWRALVAPGQAVQAGEPIGELTVLGAVHVVVAGPGARGAVAPAPGVRRGAIAVDVGWPLLTLDRAAVAGAATAAERGAAAATGGGLTVCAPSSGRYYGRPGPGKPAFVTVGDVIGAGHTVCLLEVMKTFHRVTYGGDGLPETVKVVAIAVTDEADVASGDVLVHLEALP